MKNKTWYRFIAYPSLVWFLVFLLLPVAMVFIVSFLTRGTYGGLEWIFQTKNYFNSFQDAYLGILLKSLLMASGTALFCTIVAFFMAWSISTSPKKTRSFWLFALMLPFLTNLVIRVYAIKLFVGMDGPLQKFLTFLGLPFDPFVFTANPYLVIYGLVTSYLPFAVFPLYAAFEKFDFDLVEAAQDLGATTENIITDVLIPNLKPALLSAFSLVFVPCLGEYIIPDLLGGAKQMLLGNLIVELFLKSRNWPLGAAVSVVVFLILAIFFILMQLLKGLRYANSK